MWRSKEDAVRDFMKINNEPKENEAILNEALSEPSEKEDSDGYGHYIDTRTGEEISISSSESESTEDTVGWGRGKIIKNFKDAGITRTHIQMVKKVGVGNYMIERYFAKCCQRNLEKRNKKLSQMSKSRKKLENNEKDENSIPYTKNAHTSKFSHDFDFDDNFDDNFDDDDFDDDDDDDGDDDDVNVCEVAASSTVPQSDILESNLSGADLIKRLRVIDFKNPSEKKNILKYTSKSSKSREQRRKCSEDKDDVKNTKKTTSNENESDSTPRRSYYSLASEISLNRRKKEELMKMKSDIKECKGSCYCKKKENMNFRYDPDSFPPL